MLAVTTTSTLTVPRDGGTMDLFLWTPDSPPKAALILVQEIFGVGPYIRAVAERLAGLGYLVGAPDVFWRFAPGWSAGHDQAGLDESMGMVQQLDFPAAVDDCLAALDVLAAQPGIDAAPGVIGFCMGGTLAWGVAAQGEPGVCVSYYGSGVPSMIELIDQVTCPTLFHFGNADAFLPNEGVEAVAAAIAGRPGFVINVEAAGHAFDNHESEMFYDEAAANAAWTKTVAFLTANVPA
ncbi:MAG: carboxymethylenebutenolidase [Ilumatobacteraceae bacterium]|jgi:carboxymethylenebutenolidase|nr:carboxymethylenebutenolidase [Ilumatobacteraceae bacterium]